MSSTPRSHAQTQPGQSKQPSSDVSEKSNKLAKAVAMVGGLDGGEGYGDANCSDDDNEVYRSTIDKKSRVDAIENARKQFAELALLNDIAEIAWADLHADTKTPLGSGAFVRLTIHFVLIPLILHNHIEIDLVAGCRLSWHVQESARYAIFISRLFHHSLICSQLL